MGKTSGSDHLSASEVLEFASANDPVLRVKVKGDAVERLRVEADGTVVTGDGVTAPTTDLGASGTPVVRKFPFTFDTPDILTGAALYTPTIGDILLDGWVEITTAWDGTTPLGDIGPFLSGQHHGLFSIWAYQGDPIDMTRIDDAQPGTNVASQYNQTMGGWALSMLNGTYSTGADHLPGLRWVPGRFTTADPIKVCVSQDGRNIGADPLSTQGEATLYLVTATPV